MYIIFLLLIENILLWTDTYNLTHHTIRDKGQRQDIAYIYNRNSPIRIFGLAGLINRLMKTKITKEMVDEANNIATDNKVDFPKDMFIRVVDELEGNIPLKFNMLPEFIEIPKGTPFCKVFNTKPGFAELVTYWEGYLSHAFFTSGCFTKAYNMSKLVGNIHNFGYRGSSCNEEANLSALAMGLVFGGTDTFNVNTFFYHDSDFIEPYKKILETVQKPNSIAAASHKVIQSYESSGYLFSGLSLYEDIIQKASGKRIAIPIDTYGHDRFIKYDIYSVIKQAIKSKVNVFFRIDSGNIIEQACDIINILISFNLKKVLDEIDGPVFKIIIGDSMTFNQIVSTDQEIRDRLSEKYDITFKPEYFVHYGWGANFFNDVTRDTIGWVMKLGWTHEHGATMKTTKGKESLMGDLFVKKHIPYFYVSEDSAKSSYVDYRQAVNTDTFVDEMNSRTMKSYNPVLIIDNDLKQKCDRFVSTQHF